MERKFKMLCAGVLPLVLGIGMALNYWQSQTEEPMSDLTLANLEALAFVGEGDNIGGAARWEVTPLDDEGSKRCDPGGTEFCTF
ncbi:NVEALA domain-containing protein [Millionella massiliensis]|uniref:NVEALA domain-containing protein n=1 Tax=Millionella massiliensis TaxID=1871023 RepID=UPI0008D8EA15|nr:hypothetical protein [Millionella massiliensis]